MDLVLAVCAVGFKCGKKEIILQVLAIGQDVSKLVNSKFAPQLS